jgi:hypothetical protein
MCGGGGGSSAPTQQTVTQVTIPPELMPYAKRALGTAEKLAYEQPYQTYEGQRVAGLTPLQTQAMQQIQQQQVSPQIGQATGFAGLAGLQAQKLGDYTPAQYQGMDVSYLGATAPQLRDIQMAGPKDVTAPTDLERLQMGPAERVGTQALEQYQMGPARDVQAERFGLSSLQPYMSPYMQDVVEVQKQQALQDYARNLPSLQAAGVKSGARGGTREALLQSEARKGLREQLGGIQAAGSQQAFQQGMQQYNLDQAQRMQAALANQAAGLTVGQQNLAARLGVQQLGAQQGLQAALANQAAGMQVGQQNLAAAQARQQLMAQQALEAQRLNQAAGLTTGQANLQAALQTQGLGAQTGMQAQLANQQAQLQAQQAALAQRQFGAEFGERSRQFGKNLGLQGIQQQLAAAGTLGQLGQQQFGQQQGINQAQMAAGAQLQQMEQARLQAAYEDFLNRQRYPYQQLGFMSDLIRGTPTAGGIQSIYGSQSSPLGALAGLGGLYMAGKQG